MNTMKLFAVALLAASFTAVAVFGILAMDHGDGAHGGCIGAEVAGMTCPRTNPLDLVFFHLNVFRRFSTALPVPGELTVAILFALGSVLAFLVRHSANITVHLAFFSPAAKRLAEHVLGRFVFLVWFYGWFAAQSRTEPSAA